MYKILHIPTGNYIFYRAAELFTEFPRICNLFVADTAAVDGSKSEITELELPILLKLIKKWGKIWHKDGDYFNDNLCEFEVIEVK